MYNECSCLKSQGCHLSPPPPISSVILLPSPVLSVQSVFSTTGQFSFFFFTPESSPVFVLLRDRLFFFFFCMASVDHVVGLMCSLDPYGTGLCHFASVFLLFDRF